MRSFYILNERASAPNSSESTDPISRRTGWRARLRFRDMIWAFHSETQGLLLTASLTACQGKMTWSDARALGVFLWLNSVETMVCQATILVFKIRLGIFVDTLAEIAHGSHCPNGVYGWRCP
jgi:RAVE protein 1 C terminal